MWLEQDLIFAASLIRTFDPTCACVIVPNMLEWRNLKLFREIDQDLEEIVENNLIYIFNYYFFFF